MPPVYLVHPMIVHFPIVLLLAVPVIDAFALGQGGDLAARSGIPNVALTVLLLGVAAAVVAIVFGTIAADHAAAAGFATEPVEQHEGFATTTSAIFAGIAGLRLLARWRRFPLAGGRGWIFVALTAAAAALLIATAYFGGHLVYDLGVNVAKVKP